MRPVVRPDRPAYVESPVERLRRVQVENTMLRDSYVAPQLESTGRKKDLYNVYRGPLITAWGKYCSYCEISMGTALQVEHKEPRSGAVYAGNPYGAVTWANMLLSCPACNRAKGKHPNPAARSPESPDMFLWPDTDVQFSPNNAISAFEYYLAPNVPAYMGQVDTNNAFSWQQLPNQSVALVRAGGYQTNKANRTIEMLHLNGIYDSANNHILDAANNVDRRLAQRTRAWNLALSAATRLQTIYQQYSGAGAADEDIRESMEQQIISTMYAAGFWSVWLTVFGQALAAHQLTPIATDTPIAMVKRLFVRGGTTFAVRFPGIDLQRVGLYALGDLA
jgi:5-methylcytosine-specific restriction endonuclease McrA